MEIRRAKIGEEKNIQNIIQHNAKCFGFVMLCIIQEAIKRKEVFVVVDSGNIVGFCIYHKKKDGMTRISDIGIEKNYQGKGIGSMLLKRIPRPIILDCPVDNASNKFYLYHGFRLVGIKKGNKRRLNTWILD